MVYLFLILHLTLLTSRFNAMLEGKCIKDMASNTKITWKTWQLPVGFVFISVNSTNPATSLGYGTWELLDEGIFLKSTKTSSQLNTKAGSSSVSIAHTHSIPAHSHTVNAHTHSISFHSHTVNSHSHTSAAHTHSLSNDSACALIGRSTTTMHTISYKNGGSRGGLTYDRQFEISKNSANVVSNIAGGSWKSNDVTPLYGNTNSTTPGATGSSSPGTNSAGGGNTGSSSPSTNSAGKGNTGSSGGSISIDPPHIKVYMWKRTA